MKRLLVLIAAFWVCGPLMAQTLTLPEKVQVEVGDYVELKLGGDCTKHSWEAVPNPVTKLKLKTLPPSVKTEPGYLVFSAPRLAGVYEIKVCGWTAAGLSPIVTAKVTVVDSVNPDPNPTPTPDPKPPVPPQPNPAPIPEAGFRVFVYFESEDRLTFEQNVALRSADVMSYLRSKCVKVNGAEEFRIWNAAVDPSGDSKIWQDVLKRPRFLQRGPWIVISDGRTGYEGPLPANKDGIMDLLKKYGGA